MHPMEMLLLSYCRREEIDVDNLWNGGPNLLANRRRKATSLNPVGTSCILIQEESRAPGAL